MLAITGEYSVSRKTSARPPRASRPLSIGPTEAKKGVRVATVFEDPSVARFPRFWPRERAFDLSRCDNSLRDGASTRLASTARSRSFCVAGPPRAPAGPLQDAHGPDVDYRYWFCPGRPARRRRLPLRGYRGCVFSSWILPSTDWRNGSASDSSPEGYVFESRIGHS